MNKEEYLSNRPSMGGPASWNAPFGGLGLLAFLIGIVTMLALGLVRYHSSSNTILEIITILIIIPPTGILLATVTGWVVYWVQSARYERKFRGDRAPVWTLKDPDFDTGKHLRSQLDEPGRKMAEQFLQEGFQGSVGELVVLVRELS